MSTPMPKLTRISTKVLERLRTAVKQAVTFMRTAAHAASIAAEKEAAEAQLTRERDEWNAGLLRLADALGMDAHETRQALIRESFRASAAQQDSSSKS